MEGCGGKDEQSNLFKGNNDTGSIIVLISLQSKPTRSVDKVHVCLQVQRSQLQIYGH